MKWRHDYYVVTSLLLASFLLCPPPILAASETASKVDKILARVADHEFAPIRNGFTFDPKLNKHGVADLDREDGLVRTLAIRDLIRLGRVAIPNIEAGLDHPDHHVRQVCARVLGLWPVPSARERLQRLLRTDSDPIVRSDAAVALGRICDKRSLAQLEQCLSEDKSRDVRHQCELAADRTEKQIKPSLDWAAAYESLDDSKFGTLQVGKPAIDFELTDTRGRKWRLSEFKDKGPVVLIWIFADWCPVCHHEFHDLIAQRDDFKRHNVQVFTLECHDLYRSRIMVGDESLHPNYWFAKNKAPQAEYRNHVWWPHLVDVAGAVGAVYGVDPFAFTVHSEWINRPSTVIIDMEGIVRFAYYGTFWGDRPSIKQTLNMIVNDDYDFEHPKRLDPQESTDSAEGRQKHK